MVDESAQVRALQQAILERARQLADEHVDQGEMTRKKIISDAREKIKLMEQKELLAARVNAEREYHRRVQADELRIQAELDRNRWGLVQSVMDNVKQQLHEFHQDPKRYLTIFKKLLSQAVAAMPGEDLVAHINSDDLTHFASRWDSLVVECCGAGAKISLSNEACDCSGGVKLLSASGDVMVDNTFEGIMERRDKELQQLIFERLFSTVSAMGAMFNG